SSLSLRSAPRLAAPAATPAPPAALPRSRRPIALALIVTPIALAGLAYGAHALIRGAASPAVSSAPSAMPVAPEPELRLCGSNTVGAELGPALASALLEKKGARAVKRAPGPDQQLTLEADIGGKLVTISVSARGTATAFEGLASGSCDVGMASRT